MSALADAAIHRADAVGLGRRTGLRVQRAAEESVEACIVAGLGEGGFAHVDAITLDEKTYQRLRDPAAPTRTQAARAAAHEGQGRQALQENG
ncbi:hypothetical protein [Bordetella trematum]|uniref:hypothetical protein n=1 Tax=Bordetella trematum TaxID=123899 RepID=UPI0007B54497|nr:hypothetical protein [Bordetella trematum]